LAQRSGLSSARYAFGQPAKECRRGGGAESDCRKRYPAKPCERPESERSVYGEGDVEKEVGRREQKQTEAQDEKARGKYFPQLPVHSGSLAYHVAGRDRDEEDRDCETGQSQDGTHSVFRAAHTGARFCGGLCIVAGVMLYFNGIHQSNDSTAIPGATGGLVEYFFNFDKLGYLRNGKPEGCILCMVRDGSEAVERLVVHETEEFIVSLNLYPYNPGHLLVFPRRHITDIRELSAAERVSLDTLTDLCLAVLDEVQRPAGYNIGFNMGLSAGASIEHLHLHIIPRYPHELGIAELIAGKRVLVQDPKTTQGRLSEAFVARSGRGRQENSAQ